MADFHEVQNRLYEAITETTEQVQKSSVGVSAKAGALRALAEAFAWAARPDVSRVGGSTDSE